MRKSGSMTSALLALTVLAAGCGSAQVGAGGGGEPAEGQEPAGEQEAGPMEYHEYYMEQAGLALAEGDSENALANYIEAARVLAESGEVLIKEADAHYQAAEVAYQRMEKELAIEEYDKSVQIYLRFSGNSKIKAAVALTNMGVIYKEMTEKSKARNCWENALQIYKEAPEDLRNKTHEAKIQQNIRDLDEGF